MGGDREVHPNVCVQPYSHRHVRVVCWQVDRALMACVAPGSCVLLTCAVHSRLPRRRLQVGSQCKRVLYAYCTRTWGNLQHARVDIN